LYRAFSASRAVISAEIEPLRHPSSTMSALWVRVTEAITLAMSSGRSTRRSMTSAKMFLLPSVSPAARHLGRL